jgi:hypothetical protein
VTTLTTAPTDLKSTGHTEWVEGRSPQHSFTTTFGPNTLCPHSDGGVIRDVDYLSIGEGSSATISTFAAITSRSLHEGIVHVLLTDGSVRGVSENIDLQVWRNLGTRGGGEVVGEF